MHCIPVWQSARKKWRYDFKPTKEVPVYHTDVYRLTSSPGLFEKKINRKTTQQDAGSPNGKLLIRRDETEGGGQDTVEKES